MQYKGKSVTTDPALYCDYIAKPVENFFQTDSVYSDFSKPFYTISHSKLTTKVKKLDLNENESLIKWIDTYLWIQIVNS